MSQIALYMVIAMSPVLLLDMPNVVYLPDGRIWLNDTIDIFCLVQEEQSVGLQTPTKLYRFFILNTVVLLMPYPLSKPEQLENDLLQHMNLLP